MKLLSQSSIGRKKHQQQQQQQQQQHQNHIQSQNNLSSTIVYTNVSTPPQPLSKVHSHSSSMRSHNSINKSTSFTGLSNASPNTSTLSIPALSSVSPLLFSKSPSLSILNSSLLSNDTQRLELIKSLDQSLIKFQNMKKSSSSNSTSNSNTNSILRTNILRLNLLPYLRYPIKPFTNLNELLSTSIHDLNVDLLYLEAKTLLNWWSELLNILLIDYQSISLLDRNCFYESISRLFSYNIWLLFQCNINYSFQFNDVYDNYKKLLLKTFELSILRLNSKSVSLPISIFIGKVFAYSFFNLNDISRGLSFLLNTKLNNFKKIYNICIHDSFNNRKLLSSNFNNDFQNILNDLASQFPNHLIPLISSNIQPRDVNYTIEAQFINSILPPREKIDGIRETKGIWVNRWSSLENISIFCSFFRNYLTSSSIYLKNFPLIMINQYYIFGIPGFLCFLTHIYQIFNFQINSLIIKNNNSNLKFKNSFNNNNNNINNITYNDNLLTIPPKFSTESNIDRLFNVLRDFLLNPRNINEKLLKSGVIKGYENIIKLFIIKTNILDNFMIETTLDLFIQLLKNIDVESKNENQINNINDINNNSIIDWKFWLDILIRLLDSNNLNCEVKSLSTLYQIWDQIPTDCYERDDNIKNNSKHWITNHNENLKFNLTNYLLNNENWFKFFGHYTPLERHLYNKLIIWKILGLSSLDNIINYQDFKFKDSLDQIKIKKIIQLRLLETYKMTNNIIFKPSDPVINKKFKIVKTNYNQDEKKRDKKLRIYPFEVLDDSVYTASKQSVTNSISNNSSNGILPKSISNNSLNDSHNDLKLKNSNWMNKIFNKSNSKISQSDSSNKVFTKLLNLSKNSISDHKVNESPMSSISSSLSSLELNSMENLNNLNVDEIDLSCPPEWNHDIEIKKELYEFILVNNDNKIQNFVAQLNQMNKSSNNSIIFNNTAIINDEPKIPQIILDKNDNMDSLESIIDELSFDNAKNINNNNNDNKDFYNNVELENNIIDLNGGFGNVNGIDLNFKDDNEYVTGIKVQLDNNIGKKMKNNQASLVYLSNGILEYNEEVVVFEKFIFDRIKDLKLDNLEIVNDLVSDTIDKIVDNDNQWHTQLNNVSSSSVLEMDIGINKTQNTLYRLTKPDYESLKKQIPKIVPDLAGDRLNAY
jgi:hypothetical protein